MKKSVLSILLAIVLTLMTGCTSEKTASSEVPAETSAPLETTTQATDPHSEDWYAVHTLANLFTAEYFHGNTDILKMNLADTFKGDIDVYYDYYEPSQVSPNVISIKGLDDIGEMAIGDICYPSIEFVSGLPGDDSYTYLSLVMIKQEDGWKVQSYGLEK